MKFRVQSIGLLAMMALFAGGAAIFLHFVGHDALLERNEFQFYADSNTYHLLYAGEIENEGGEVVAVSKNYAGPLLLLRLLHGNVYLVMLLNVALFTVSLAHMTKLLRVSPLKAALLLLLSPLTFSALLSVNKEILLFPFVALALHAYVRRSMVAVLLALGLSVLVRWQLTAFYLVALLATYRLRYGPPRALVLVAILVAASAAYVLLLDWIAPVIAAVEFSTETGNQGTGLYSTMLALQNRGAYFLVFPVKALHLLFGLGLRFDRLLAPGNIFNDFFVLVHCQATLLVFAALVWKRLFSLRSDLVFASLLFLIVFCLTPIFAPRYLYPVFLLWVLVLAGAPAQVRPRGRPAAAARPMSCAS